MYALECSEAKVQVWQNYNNINTNIYSDKVLNSPLKAVYIQGGKKVFSQPPIVQVLPLKKMRETCNFHHRYTSTMRDKIRK